ncbi:MULTISPECIES: HNH endonuclease [Acinetobacter]|uniref:HNH endonuclease n=1 Tax=Acinetobacter TaxID=469 RepID=UPI0002D0CF19|nr:MULTISPECIES: HNH endonuclease [Acinetobacter]ENU89235.1 hypothetical protein F972_01490 [Acinetobacter sp. CIP 102529]
MKVQLENIDVHAFFEYKDGQLIWKMLPDYYAEWNVLNRLNSRFFGTRAGRLNKRGYRDIGIWGEKYLEHRIIFFMHHGYLPKLIDHIDGNTTNNRIENLREASQSQNAMNSKRPISNSSGCKGVVKRKNENKWMAQITKNGKVIYLGTFKRFEDAVKARIDATKLHHGEYANFDGVSV